MGQEKVLIARAGSFIFIVCKGCLLYTSVGASTVGRGVTAAVLLGRGVGVGVGVGVGSGVTKTGSYGICPI